MTDAQRRARQITNSVLAEIAQKEQGTPRGDMARAELHARWQKSREDLEKALGVFNRLSNAFYGGMENDHDEK